jgi:hypothetical protein
MEKVQNPAFLSVKHHHKNPLETNYIKLSPFRQASSCAATSCFKFYVLLVNLIVIEHEEILSWYTSRNTVERRLL